jgi:hypothetical protein
MCPFLSPRVVTWAALSSSKSSRRFRTRSKFQAIGALRPLSVLLIYCLWRQGDRFKCKAFSVSCCKQGRAAVLATPWKLFSIHRFCSKGKYRHVREGGCFVYWLALWRHITIMNCSIIFCLNAEWCRVLHVRSMRVQFGVESWLTFILRSRLRPHLNFAVTSVVKSTSNMLTYYLLMPFQGKYLRF